nr:hypothetical protein [uncultured Fusobacterium sp.]
MVTVQKDISGNLSNVFIKILFDDLQMQSMHETRIYLLLVVQDLERQDFM